MTETHMPVFSSGIGSTHSVAKRKTWWVENWRRGRGDNTEKKFECLERERNKDYYNTHNILYTHKVCMNLKHKQDVNYGVL